MTVRNKHPLAGLYETEVEARDIYGHPVLLTVRWLYISSTVPLWGLALALCANAHHALILTEGDLEQLELLAQAIVDTRTNLD